ncbi:MAG: sporulation protein YtfJ [Firmicutes bacterium]|nr:sporulation protein YtfJ [Bacillota bacterium]
MEGKHPIEGLMQTAMESLKTMVDVNTILGDPVETADGQIILPVSRVSFGFAAGGGEFSAAKKSAVQEGKHPFGGGSGAGIALNPVAFLVVGPESVRLLPVDQSAIYDRLIDLAPQFLDRIQGMMRGEKANGVLRTTYKV